MKAKEGHIRIKFLKTIYGLSPFDLSGDLKGPYGNIKKGLISCCLICASRRLNGLRDLLFDLAGQTLEKDNYEVVVLNDGGGQAVEDIIDPYRKCINIVYAENERKIRILGVLRNKTIEMSRGEYLLFLDDDTRILQKDFLTTALRILQNEEAEVVQAKANAHFGIVKKKYDFLDEYSFSNRCCLYRKKTVEAIKGFKHCMNTYEDTELSIRLSLKGCNVIKTDRLQYFHPPLYFDSMQKPLCIGQSIMNLRKEYSFLVWLMAYINALRFLVLIIAPTCKNVQWFRISWGVLIAPFQKKAFYY